MDVTDDNNVLNGYWKSRRRQTPARQQQPDRPVHGHRDRRPDQHHGDFGYYATRPRLGDFVWDDLDGDGIQDARRAGHPGVRGHADHHLAGRRGTTTSRPTTDANGSYSFGNLLLDEDFR